MEIVNLKCSSNHSSVLQNLGFQIIQLATYLCNLLVQSYIGIGHKIWQINSSGVRMNMKKIIAFQTKISTKQLPFVAQLAAPAF